MKKLVTFLFLFSFSILFAQKETANWFFGSFAGLDFNRKTPIPLKGQLATLEGCASVSNRNGKLLFYTDGKTIWNSNHQIMLNGTGLFGDWSSTQTAMIIPKPGSSTIYYVFTVSDAQKIYSSDYKNGMNYTVVDMNLDNGLGGVVTGSKNIHLVTYNPNDNKQFDWKVSEKIAATLHADEKSYWVVTQFVDTFYAFLVDYNGVNESAIRTQVSEVNAIYEHRYPGAKLANVSAIGAMKLSPNGEKLAMAISSNGPSRTTGKVFLYDFDKTTGKVSTSGLQLMSNTYPYGIEFSPNSNLLYASSSNYKTFRGVTTFEGSSIHQFDLSSPNIKASQTTINNSSALIGGALQLAMDGKIYRAKYNQVSGNGGQSLGVINKPNFLGLESNYSDNGVNLLPETNSEYGLPPFISSSLLLTFDYAFTCLGNNTHFYIQFDDPYDSLIWDFGDGTTSTEDEPYHTYARAGSYEVSLTTTYRGVRGSPMTKIVEIENPIEVLTSTYELYECDALGDMNDGITNYNLELANDAISLGNGNTVNVYYYNSLDNLNNDIENTNALNNIYTNKVRDEILFAKVVSTNSDCFGIVEVALKTSPLVEFQTNNLIGCNLGDGTGEFRLSDEKSVILQNLNLDLSSNLTFYENQYNATLSHAPLSEIYISEPKTIFFRIENQNVCHGIGKLELELNSLPNIDKFTSINICSSFYPYTINAGIPQENRDNYTFQWENGSTSFETVITNPGDYEVVITDLSTQCNFPKTISVNTIDTPEIQNIVVRDDVAAYSATVQTSRLNGSYRYALDNPNGPYQEEAIFLDLAPGTYTIYAQDIFNCTTVSRQFNIFGFPKFFTPNNDGHNDVWELKGLDFYQYTYSDIGIYDRFGKLLTTITPTGYWDGLYNGKLMPSDDYWFVVTVTDKDNKTETYKKHFSLIR